MWTAPVLFWVLGSVWFWDSAQGGTIGALEDDIVTPGTEEGMVIPGLEDRITTTVAAGGRSESTGKTPLVPTPREGGAKPPIEDLPTVGTSGHDHKEHERTTTARMMTSHSAGEKTSHPDRGNADDETQTTDKKDGLAVVTLVGIIVGVLLAIGVVGGLTVVVMRKISGRFSP